MASDMIALLLDASLAAGVAILAVLVLRRPLRRLAGARAAYAAWIVVPAATVAACLPALPAPAVVEVLDVAGVRAAFAAATSRAAAASPAAWLVWAWFGGALAGAGLLALQQRRFLRRLAARDAGSGDAGENFGPAVVGLWRPRIVLPPDFQSRYTPAEQALVLEHERQHLRRGDLWVQAACALARCLLWFHPLVHLAAARLRFDQELACDTDVLARHPHQRRAYGEAMLKTELAGFGAPVGCHWQSCHPLKERLMMLKQSIPGPARRRLGLALVAALAAAGSLAALASPPASEAKIPVLQAITDADVITPPAYPKAALDAGISGKVMLKVLVRPDGTVGDVQVVRSTPAGVFDEPAIAAARQWKFTPSARTSTGESVVGWVMVPVQFEADGTPPENVQ